MMELCVPVPSSLSQPARILKKPAVQTARTRDELFRIVCALSAACKSDRNVLKDSQLVDLLETQAKQILRQREQHKQGQTAKKKQTNAPAALPQASNKTAKKLKSMLVADEESSKSIVAKRRKLSFEKQDSSVDSANRYAMPHNFPSIQPKDKQGEARISQYAVPPPMRSHNISIIHVKEEHMMYQKPLRTSPNKTYRKQLLSPFKSLDRPHVDLSSSIASTGSTASILHSEDLDDLSPEKYRRYYSPAMDSRGRQSPFDATQSVDFSMEDWTPTDDEEEETEFAHVDTTPIQDELKSLLVAGNSLSRVSEAATDMENSSEAPLDLMELSSVASNEAFKYARGDAVVPKRSLEKDMIETQPVAGSSTDGSCQTQQKSPTEVVMEVLYGIMKHDDNFKWLIDPMNQSRVAKLVDYHLSQQGTNSTNTSFVEDLRSELDRLVHENTKFQTENMRLIETSQMSECEVEELALQKQEIRRSLKQQSAALADVAKQLAESQEIIAAQESCRREAELFFQSELDAKNELVASLQTDLQEKENEVATLMKRVENISTLFATKMRETNVRFSNATQRRSTLSPRRSSLTSVQSFHSSSMVQESSSLDVTESKDDDHNINVEEDLIMNLRETNHVRELQVKKLKSALVEKDREICNLYMNLSIKKKLIEDITKKFVQNMEEMAAKSAQTPSSPVDATTFPREGIQFDMDMFLFRNVVEKQRRVDELTAALGFMEREVLTLEARVVQKEKENLQLKANQEDLSMSLRTANAQVLRIQAANEQMDSTLKDKQVRIRNLVEYLEEKEQHISYLDEQVSLRQSQLDQFVDGGYEHSDNQHPSKTFQRHMSQLSFTNSLIGKKGEGERPSNETYQSSLNDCSDRPSSKCERSHLCSGETDPRLVGDRSSLCEERGSTLSAAIDAYSRAFAQDEASYEFHESADDCISNRASYSSSLVTDDDGELLLKYLTA